MITTPIPTRRLQAGECTLTQFLDESLDNVNIPPGSVLAITSKVVSLCEGAVAPAHADRDQLVTSQAQRYLASRPIGEPYSFTIARNVPTTNSGVDESNVSEGYVLLPANPQSSANAIRRYLVRRLGYTNVGVVITDSTCLPLRWGMFGMCLAHSGFMALRDYKGKPDLFGRPFQDTYGDIATGLSASATLVMGEGDECTPLAVLSDLPFVMFTGRNPSVAELDELVTEPTDDLYYPFFSAVQWHQASGR